MSEEKEPEITEEIEWEDSETTTRSDLISCAYYAYTAVEDIDLTLVSKFEANRIKTIKDNMPTSFKTTRTNGKPAILSANSSLVMGIHTGY